MRARGPRALWIGVAAASYGALSCTLDRQGALESAPVLTDAAVQDVSPILDAHAEGSSWDVSMEQPLDATPDEKPEACVIVTDKAFCAYSGKSCGTFVGVDLCGKTRQAECGTCAGAAICGGDGVDNVCGSWWDCAWSSRQRLEVHAISEVPNGYAVTFTFDHAALVTAGASRADGQDVRVVRRQGQTSKDVVRVLDPESRWNDPATRIWFPVQADVPQGAVDAQYHLYYGNPDADPAPADESQVFHFADYFDRADSTTVGNGWNVLEDDGTKLNILGGALWFETTADKFNRPAAEHDFAPITGGLVVRLGFNWVRNEVEGTYRLHMQLGSSTAMDNPPTNQDAWITAGVGPSLLWAGPNQGVVNQEGFGYASGTTAHEIAVATGRTSIQVGVDVPSHTFQLAVAGTLVSDLAFSSPQDSIDRIRLMTWGLNHVYFGQRAFEYVIVRKRVSAEPTLSLAGEQKGTCTQ